MPVSQPAGAIRSFAFKPHVSAVFSPDSSRFYAASNDGSVTAYNVATGAVVATWQVGTNLGGMDITPDGRTLVVVERDPISMTGDGENVTIVSGVYKIDIATGTKTLFTTSAPAVYPGNAYYDVAALADGTVILSKSSQWKPLTRLDLGTGTFSNGAAVYTQDGALTRSFDYQRTLYAPGGTSDAPLHVLDGSGNVLANHGNYQDGVSGYNRGIQAISSNGNLVVQYGYIYDLTLDYKMNFYQKYQQFNSTAALGFNPAGTVLYLLERNSDYVFEVSTATFEVIRGFTVDTNIGELDTFAPNYGDTLQVSADGRYLSVFGENALQVIDLTKVVADGGTSGNDNLTGNSDANYLYGFDGNDVLNGLAGQDYLYGNTGDDTYYVDNGGDYVIEYPNQGFDQVFTSVSYTIPGSVERLVALEGFAIGLGGSENAETLVGNNQDNVFYASGGRDTIIAGGGSDLLDGGAGNDNLYGGAGNDLYYADSRGDLIFENADEGNDWVIASVGFYLYDNIERLKLDSSAASAFGVGNGLANILEGNQGDNLLIGGGGDDSVEGYNGNDSLFGESGNDTLSGGRGIDYLAGGIGNDTLTGGDEADALYGEDGDDLIDGGDTFHTDILVGGAGNDTLDGTSGLGDYDRMDGGAGDDLYFVDTPNDLTFEAAGGGIDTVYANINGAGYYLYAFTENLILEGNTPFGVGNELANQLTGNAIANYLLGGLGNDTLNGKAGNDVLFGEGGADTFVFERGTAGDVIGDFQAGTDKISLVGLGFANYVQLQPNIFQVGGNTGINLGQGDFIVLNGVTNAQLSATDFLFG